jgi:radical SAM protein (TIGR01212 family)
MYYNSFSHAMRERFGGKVYKLSLDSGMSCPNRDGTLGTGGCIFCGERGAGEFAEGLTADIETQINRAKAKVAFKTKPDTRYIAYFQSFTNTYAPLDRLEGLYMPIAERDDICAISIATRPDCLPPPTVELLERINRIKPVWVELGLQTIHDDTAKRINRGYDTAVYDDAVTRLRASGIEVVTHMIIGLPGESEQMIFDTAEHIGRVGSDGIKLHLLYILRGTELERMYLAGEYTPLEMDEFIRLLIGCIRRLPRETVIHRMTGDGAKRDLTAPLWSGDKKRVLNAINQAFEAENVIQGSLWQGST